MRGRYAVVLMVLFAVIARLPFRAQLVKASEPVRQQPTKPEVVVARLMSFDTNHDGRVTRAELPERMRGLLVRGDMTKDDALDRAEVLRLAKLPPAPASVRGLQPGHYGFGEDSGLDTRLHIEGAIEDLRLASATRDKALGIGRTFAERTKTQAKANLLAAATRLLSAGQLATFKAALGRAPASFFVPTLVLPQGAMGGANAEVVQSLMARMRQPQSALTRLVAQLDLGAAEKKQLQAAIQRFKAHDRLSAGERTALVNQLRSVLTVEERDDLRAALERRPIIKQDGSTGAVATSVRVVAPAAAPRMQDVPQQLQFRMHDLVLHQ